MKSKFLFTALLAGLCITATGCRSSEKTALGEPQRAKNVKQTVSVDNITADLADADNLLSAQQLISKYGLTGREVPVGKFRNILCEGIVKVFFVPSKHHKVTVYTNAKTRNYAQVSADGATLRLSSNNHSHHSIRLNNGDMVLIIVNAPTLNGLRANGAATFNTGNITAERFDITLNGATRASFGTLKTLSATLNASGASKFKGDIQGGTSQITLNGAAKATANITADQLNVTNNGAAQLYLDFKGKTISLDNNGAAKVEATLECEQLTASNNGAAKLRLAGTADDTKIKGTGASSVDTRELNKF